jgi:hypothetical protein
MVYSINSANMRDRSSLRIHDHHLNRMLEHSKPIQYAGLQRE